MQWREELIRRFPALTKLGGDSFVVGGAIRDLLLGRNPADVDIACNDPLAAARTIRDRVIRLGEAEHLSAYRVVESGHVYDLAELLDHDIDIDLARRDFTINAMAVRLGSGDLLDPHGGQRDIAARVVRMVQASNFDDDPLRALKGVRMAVTFGFSIDDQTLAAIRERAARIVEIAAERVTYELSVTFSAGRLRTAVDLLQRTALLAHLGLSSRSLHADDVSLAGAYALLVEDPRVYATRWRLSSELVREVLTLRQLIDSHHRIALYDAGETIARQLPGVLRALGRDDRLDFPDFAIRAWLGGGEIAQLTGLKPGAKLGKIKRALLEAQVRGEVKTKDEAVAFVRASTAST